MSSNRRTLLRDAEDDIREFAREIGLRSLVVNWTVCGSVRRRRPEVNDVDHVIIPRVTTESRRLDLFSRPVQVNHLWERLNSLRMTGHTLRPWTSSAGQECWGETQRRVIHNSTGRQHDFTLATPENWGLIVMVKTGPADFGRIMCQRLRERGMRYEGAHVWTGTERGTGEIIPTPTEESLFALIGLAYIMPADRDEFAREADRRQVGAQHRKAGW